MRERGAFAEQADEAIEPKLLSLPAAGRCYGGDTSVETLRSWIKAGLLRKVKIGRRVFVLRSDLDDLIDRQLGEQPE